MGDSSPKSKNKKSKQDLSKKKSDAASAAAKQAPAETGLPGKKAGR